MSNQNNKHAVPFALCEVPLCKGLSEKEIAALKPLFQAERVPAKVALVQGGQRNTSVSVICSGSVKVVREECGETVKILNIMGHGEIVGETSVLEKIPAYATVIALEPCHVLRMESEHFRQALIEFPHFSYNLIESQSRRIRLLSKRILAITKASVRCRVAHQLLLFAETYDFPAFEESYCGQEDILLPLMLKQKDLAGLVGASREQVNRVLSAFQSEGYLSISLDHRFTLHGTQGLLRYC